MNNYDSLEKRTTVANTREFTLNDVLTAEYFQMPKYVFYDMYDDYLNNDARVIYMYCHNRHRLSIKNNWVDDDEKIYFYFSVDEIQQKTKVSRSTSIRAMKALSDCNLIKQVRQGQGKPNKIYLLMPSKLQIADTDHEIITDEHEAVDDNQDLSFPELLGDVTEIGKPIQEPNKSRSEERSVKSELSEVSNLDFLKYQSDTSRSVRNGLLEVSDLDPSKNKDNKNNINSLSVSLSSPLESRTENGQDGQDKTGQTSRTEVVVALPENALPEKSVQPSFEELPTEEQIEVTRELIKENISYTSLVSRKSNYRIVNEMLEVMIDILYTDAKTVKIEGETKPLALVKSAYMKLSHDHIQYCINQLNSVLEPITKTKNYLRTMLYNSLHETESSFSNEYAIDRWVGG